MIKVPNSSKTKEFYSALTAGKVKRGIWGAGARFNPVKIANKSSVKTYYIDVIKPYLDGKQDILDIGCGPGGFLKATAPMCNSVTGIDLTPSFVSECQRMIDAEGIENAKAMQGSASSLPFSENSFDCIIMVDTIHHLDDVTSSLNEVYRVLKPGGTLLIFEPNKGNPLLTLMCILDKNEWGLLSLGSKRAYRRLFSNHYHELACEFNGLLIGPDSNFSLALSDLMARQPWRRFIGWMSPKLFMAYQKKV